MPKDVEYIISTLEEHGFEAYAVGGCIRDSILGYEPSDWDITTNALPENIKECFKKTFDTGIKHGTISVLLNNKIYEVTTYRIDGSYSDNRHPDSVTFSRHLKEDLLRRDFTINAMAYNNKDGLIDMYGGLDDLDNKKIRCVGEPLMRFDEDALRMLRAIRFAAVLNFDIEDNTFDAISQLNSQITKISVERIYVELIKLLNSDNPGMLEYLVTSGLSRYIFDDKYDLSKFQFKSRRILYKILADSKNETLSRLSIFCAFPFVKNKNDKLSLDKKKNVDSYNILHKLKSDNKTIRDVSTLSFYYNSNIVDRDEDIRLEINNIGRDNYLIYVENKCLIKKYNKSLFDFFAYKRISEYSKKAKNIYKKNDPVEIKDLDIRGEELISIGYNKGPEIGVILEKLLLEVIKNPLLNKKEKLLDIAKSNL